MATQTQKDPKEYVPYLQELQKIESKPYMRFRVHVDLKEYREALFAIAESPEEDYFQEVLEIVKKQRLFKVALEIFAKNQTRLRTIQESFGEYLVSRGYHEEAGFAYLQAQSLSEAQRSFEVALNVHMVLVVARR